MHKRTIALLTLLLLAALLLAGCGPFPSLSRLLDRGQSDDGQQVEQQAEPETEQPAPTAAPVVRASSEMVAAIEGTLQEIYIRVNPAVVNIQVIQNVSIGETMPGFPFQFEEPQGSIPQQGLGSGFVWDKDGHIVTNYHVVESASDIQVTFYDGRTAQATVVGTDPDSDLAVLHVDVPAGQLQPVQMGDSSEVQVGELAIAIGNPYGYEGTMTAGIISAIGRSLPAQSTTVDGSSYTIPDIIQTDAPINPGNSGGILINDQGEVIGVTSAIESTTGSNSGIGFAIPSDIVQRVVPALIDDGQAEHPWLGISGTTLTADLAEAMDLDANQRGALVIEVTAGGPAKEAGLQGSDREVTIDGLQVSAGGDVIVAIDDQPVNTFDDLPSYLARSQVGQKVTLTVLRDGREVTLDLTLGSRPSSGMASTQQPESGSTTGQARLGIVGTTVTPAIAQAMDLDQDQQGVLVEQVQPGSPADEAGLRGSFKPVTIDGQEQLVGGDIIIAVDRQQIAGMDDLRDWLAQAEPGDKVTLTILRDGREGRVEVTLE